MNRLAALTATEARLLAREWTVLVFAFAFPALCMLILAGVFGHQPDKGFAMRRPDDYYVTASIGVPVIALALVGLPVALASYRERGVLRRLDAFGISITKILAAQAIVTCGLIALAVAVVLVLAAPTYGIPHMAHPGQILLGLSTGTITLVLLGIAIGLAAPSARTAQAIGLLTFFPLYLLGGGGPPTGAMTGPMRAISNALPSGITAISDPWLGVHGLGSRLAVLSGWAVAALLAAGWLAARPST